MRVLICSLLHWDGLSTSPWEGHAVPLLPRCIVAEPLFLPNGAGGSEWLGHDHEDDGWIVSALGCMSQDEFSASMCRGTGKRTES